LAGRRSGTRAAKALRADRDDEGAPIYRVVVGAYLTRAEAQATAERVRSATGARGFVRPL
jgi:hypothetical protein